MPPPPRDRAWARTLLASQALGRHMVFVGANFFLDLDAVGASIRPCDHILSVHGQVFPRRGAAVVA